MGTFNTKVRVANMIDRSRTIEIEAMVDTGASYSWISKSKLDGLGITPLSQMKFKTISGGLIEREMAPVMVTADGKTAADNVVMAHEGDLEVIGAFTLEALGVTADVVQRKLVPTIGWALTAGL